MQWSVDEQAVALAGGASLRFEVDAADFAVVHLLMFSEDGSGSKLTFARNGAYQGASKIEKPAEGESEPAVAATGAKTADDDDDNHKKRGRHYR